METQRLCPLCGSSMPIPVVDEAAMLRVEILLLRQRLDELERAGVSFRGAVVEQVYRDPPDPDLADREQLQERIDQGLRRLQGGYGTED